MKQLALSLIKFYRKYGHNIVPTGSCRFDPTCSAYAYEAVSKYGTMTGTKLAVKRILRCHPFSPGGIDNVP
jgi:putative membrane protein insertion efficiency factor